MKNRKQDNFFERILARILRRFNYRWQIRANRNNEKQALHAEGDGFFVRLSPTWNEKEGKLGICVVLEQKKQSTIAGWFYGHNCIKKAVLFAEEENRYFRNNLKHVSPARTENEKWTSGYVAQLYLSYNKDNERFGYPVHFLCGTVHFTHAWFYGKKALKKARLHVKKKNDELDTLAQKSIRKQN